MQKDDKIMLSKLKLMWSTILPLIYSFLVIGGIFTVILIIAAVTHNANPIDVLIGLGLWWLLLLIILFASAMYIYYKGKNNDSI